MKAVWFLSHRLLYSCYSGNQVSLESSNTSQGGKGVCVCVCGKSGSQASITFSQAETLIYILFYKVLCKWAKHHSTHSNKRVQVVKKSVPALQSQQHVRNTCALSCDSSVDHRSMKGFSAFTESRMSLLITISVLLSPNPYKDLK